MVQGVIASPRSDDTGSSSTFYHDDHLEDSPTLSRNPMFYLDEVARSIPEPLFPPDTLNSDVSDILRATRPFLDTDRDWIIPNTEGLQQQVSVYDTLLDRIDEVRSEVQTRRDAVHKSMASYSSILAPVRRLPFDVLKSVFHEMQILKRQSYSGYSHEGLDLTHSPWALSHVCGAWRDIVLSYPQLWSHIALCLQSDWAVCRIGPTKTLHTTRHMLVALEAIILRSDQCPLDIMLSRAVEGRNLDTGMTDKVFAMILEVSHRWRTLMVHWIPLDFIERLKVVRGRIPCLESLTWSTSNGADLPEDIRIVFSDAPCLRKAILQGTCNLKNLLLSPHITHLAARVESVSNLGIYQSLVECHLELQPRHGIDSDTSLIFLPNVQRLFVTSFPVLAHLCLPALNDLTITVVGGNNQQAIQLMNDFLHRSRCDLTRLASYNRGNEILVHESLLSMDTLIPAKFAASTTFWFHNVFISISPYRTLSMAPLYAFVHESAPLDWYYTTSASDKAVWDRNQNYVDRGVYAFMFGNAGCGGVPFYTLRDPVDQGHLFTADQDERRRATSVNGGYIEMGIAAFQIHLAPRTIGSRATWPGGRNTKFDFPHDMFCLASQVSGISMPFQSELLSSKDNVDDE
ncbi:hypothetical protein F5146DRAFT_1120594 [Armillaria mellea]|nr:hypothetical protein F5146DRAFT_1120594 [Armillaria mellea]